MSYGLSSGNSQTHRFLEFNQQLALESAFELSRGDASFTQDLLGGKIAVRSVMLVKGVDSDPAGNGSGGESKSSTECIVRLVGNADPINGAQDDGLFGSEKDHAAGAQAQIPFVGDRIIGQEAADGRCGINVEN